MISDKRAKQFAACLNRDQIAEAVRSAFSSLAVSSSDRSDCKVTIILEAVTCRVLEVGVAKESDTYEVEAEII